MDPSTAGQLRVIRKVVTVTGAADIPAWLFGGWGLDARVGRITREHGDVEFWVERIHAERSKAVLVGAGAAALTTQPPEEACEFTWDDVPLRCATYGAGQLVLFSHCCVPCLLAGWVQRARL